MRIRVGKRQWTVNTDGRRAEVPSEVGKAIAQTILDDLQEDILRVSAPRLRRVAAQLEAVGNDQARQIMATIGLAIGKMKGRIYPADIRGRSDAPQPGFVQWDALKFHYAVWKQKAAATRRYRVDPRVATTPNSHFILTGRLERYFQSSTRAFGGVKVKVDTSGLRERRTIDIHSGATGEGSGVRLLLARFQISILPQLNTHLMPGLASRRWTDVGSGEFEEAVFGRRTAVKMVGHDHVPYRPLALPIIQYFAIARIPGAIRAQMSRVAKSVLEGQTYE